MEWASSLPSMTADRMWTLSVPVHTAAASTSPMMTGTRRDLASLGVIQRPRVPRFLMIVSAILSPLSPNGS